MSEHSAMSKLRGTKGSLNDSIIRKTLIYCALGDPAGLDMSTKEVYALLKQAKIPTSARTTARDLVELEKTFRDLVYIREKNGHGVWHRK